MAEAEEPSLTPMAAPAMVVEAMRENGIATAALATPAPAIEEVRTTAPSPLAEDEAPPVEAQAAPDPGSDHVVLRIIEDIPAFAGPGRTYRLQKEDLVSLPQGIAKALILRKKAVGVQMPR